MMSYEIIFGFARAFPLIIISSVLLSYFLTNNVDLLLLGIFLSINDVVNHGLKTLIFKPLIGGKTLPFLGIGKRPNGAKNCGMFKYCPPEIASSYGMPSGHSQNAVFFSTYVILNLINSNFIYPTKVYGTVLFTSLALGIMYSRVYFKCHTVQQVIVGGLIGGVLGALYYENKDKIKKLLKLH